jgi:hypothetical protein
MYALPFKFEWLCYFILNACYFSIFWSILLAKKINLNVWEMKKKCFFYKKKENSGGSDRR